MRYIVYLLLAANAVYFGWNQLRANPEHHLVRQLPPIPPSVRSLVTLREMQDARRTPADGSEIDAINQLEPPGAGPAPDCQALGPFLAANDLQQAEDALDSRGLAAHPYEDEESVEIGYWIYMPPRDWEAAKKITAMLDEKGDKVYFIGKDNLVALGTFDTETRAKVRLEQLREYGLDPVLEPRYKTRTVHWLELKAGGNGRTEIAAILEKFPQTRLRGTACHSIARQEGIN